jgi:hypothetical protein
MLPDPWSYMPPEHCLLEGGVVLPWFGYYRFASEFAKNDASVIAQVIV